QSPVLLDYLREPSLLRSHDSGRGLPGSLDRAARVLDLGVTVDRRVVRRVRVTGERGAGDLVPVSGRFDVVPHDHDAVERKITGHLDAAVHQQDALGNRVRLDLEIALD